MLKKFFTWMIVLLLLFTNFDLTNFRQPKVSAEKGNSSIKIPREIQKVKELIDLREPNSKTYLNSDGTYTTEIFTEDIHYEEDGELKTIFNTPIMNDEKDKNEFQYKNKENRFSVKFAKNTTKNKLISLKFKKEKLNFKLQDSTFSEGIIKDGKIVYPNAYKDVDLEYSILNSGIKEDIYLNSNNATRKFEFLITGSLTPKQENRHINFYNKNNELVWVMSHPFMEDQKGKYSEEFQFDVEKSKDGYVLSIIPDEAFLDAEDTVYPVRIDPPTILGGSSSSTYDSFVMQNYPSYNYHDTPELRTGYTSSVGITRSYLDFSDNLPSLGGKLLVGASLHIYKWDDIYTGTTNKVFLNRLLQPWDDQTITWYNKPTYDASVNYGLMSSTGSAKDLSMNVTALVDGWIRGRYDNHGVVLRSESESSYGTYQKFNSSESSFNKPYLAVTYSQLPSAPSATPYSNGDSTGYVNLSWNKVNGASGYKVLIYNGKSYEEIDVGNVTSWSTKGKRLWPTNYQIDSGNFGIRKNGDGKELPENPNYLYKKSGSKYTTNKNYWFRVKAYNKYGETTQSAEVKPVIPDETAPTKPGAVQITNNRVDGFTVGWQPSSDIDGSGVAKYKVYIGDNKSDPNIEPGTVTSSTSYTTSKTLDPRKTYYAWVKAIDKSSNISSTSDIAQDVARKDFDAEIVSYSIPSDYDIDNVNGQILEFNVKNTGITSWTNDLNVNLAVTSVVPKAGSSLEPFKGQLDPGEVIRPGEIKTFTVNWKPVKAVIGEYELKAVVSKGETSLQIITPVQNAVIKKVNVTDITPPMGEIVINNGNEYTNSPDVSIRIQNVKDNAEGDLNVQLANGPINASVEELAFSPIEGKIPPAPSYIEHDWRLVGSDAGERYVYARFIDSSGNSSEISFDSIILDENIPEISSLNISNGDFISGVKSVSGVIKDKNIKEYKLEYWDTSDDEINWYLIENRNTDNETYTLNSDGTYTLNWDMEWDTSSLETGEYELRISVTDGADNTNWEKRTIWIDNVDKDWTGSESFYPTYPLSLSDGSGFVNLYNGSLNIQDIDFSLSSRTYSLLAGRSYASNRVTKGLLGTGWMSTLEERLIIEDEMVKYVDADGTVHSFISQSDGTFSSPEGTSYLLSSNGTSYELIEKNGRTTSKIFKSSGQLEKLTDLNGNEMSVVYENGQIKEVISANKMFSVQYNTDQTISDIVFSTGDKIHYTYDNGFLVKVERFTRSGTISTVTQYGYTNSQLTSVIAENGLKTSFEYNGNRLIKTSSSRSTRKVDSLSLMTYGDINDQIIYNLTNRKINISKNSVDENEKSKNLANVEYSLNAEGNVQSRKIIRTYTENEDPSFAQEDGNNIVIQTNYSQNRLQSVTDGMENQTYYDYDAFGNIIKVTLPAVTSNGQSSVHDLTYVYNERGQLLQSKNALNLVKSYEYDENGNLVKVVDEEGNRKSYTYDSYGNVVSTISNRGPLYGFVPDYSMESDSLSDWVTSGTVKKVSTERTSGTKSVEISTNGKLQSKKIAVKKGRLPVQAFVRMKSAGTSSVSKLSIEFLNGDSLIQTVVEEIDSTTEWAQQKVLGEIPSGATHVRVSINNISGSSLFVDDLVLEEALLESKYEYDATGEFVEKVIDPYGTVTTYTYNDYGQVLTETNGLNQKTESIYDDENRLKQSIDRANRITEYKYDSMNNVVQEINSLGQTTHYEYNEWGQIISKKLPTVTITTYQDEQPLNTEQQSTTMYYEYDELGRKIKETDAKGNILSQEFDGYGRVSKVIDPMQNQKIFSYDQNGNVVRTMDYAMNTSFEEIGAVLLPQGEKLAEYDEWNRQISETDNTGNRNVVTFTNTFDAENRLVHSRDSEGDELYYEYNAINENTYTKDNSNPVVESWTYFDGLGSEAVTIDGSIIQYSVTDAVGNLIESIDHKGVKTTYEYNVVGDKVKQVNTDGSTIEWTYNEDGQVLSEKKRVEDTATTTTYLTTTYTYNNAAEVVKQTIDGSVISKSTQEVDSKKLKETNITYDELGRVVREEATHFEGESSKKSDIRFLYDLNGNLIRKWIYDESSNTLLSNGQTSYPFVRSDSVYKYDDNNRLISEDKNENGVVSLTYKDDENAEIIQSALGQATIYYNENDLVKKIITPEDEEFQFSYTVSDLIKEIRGPRLTHKMNYGPNEKMTQIQTNKKDTETVIFSETYEYNKDEQIIKATNNDSEQKTYAYTKEGFLQSVTRGSGTIQYTYDLNGNLLKSEDQSGKLLSENKYLQGNRISTSIQYNQETDTYRHISYEFRENGSLAKETIRQPVSTSSGAEQAAVDVVKEYHYSSFNLLMSITTKQGSTVIERIEYTYDSEDNRTSKKVTNAEGERFEFYYYDSNGGLVSLSRKIGDDLLENTMNFYRDASGKLLNFKYKDDKVYDYVFNQRGDVVAITNEVQEVIARYSYDEWGNLIALEGLTPIGQEVAEENPYRYVGHYGVQHDSDTGLYYMGWRDYDAKIGRFIVADEYEGDETDPISFNTYLYAEADPVNNIDPDGHFAKWIKKLRKGFKKGGVGVYDFLIGDDLKTITSKNTRWYQKVGAAAMIASNFVPGLNVVGKAAKAARATYKAVKTVRATYNVAKVAVKTNAKRVAARALRAPKTVGVKSYRNTKKFAGTVKAKVQQHIPRKSRTKTSSASNVSQRNVKKETRNVEYERKTQTTTQGADEVATTSELSAKDIDIVPHGNSKNSTKLQHGYNIFEKETGDVVKTGISGRSLNKNGSSPRANSQVNKWNKDVGYDKYGAVVVNANIPNRQKALAWERENAQHLWEEGNSMAKHRRPKPWEE